MFPPICKKKTKNTHANFQHNVYKHCYIRVKTCDWNSSTLFKCGENKCLLQKNNSIWPAGYATKKGLSCTHRYPPTPPPLLCSCWRQACLCSPGRSVDLQAWHFLLAAPCGETRSRGPCAPSGFSSDLNNCKTQRRFAKQKPF